VLGAAAIAASGLTPLDFAIACAYLTESRERSMAVGLRMTVAVMFRKPRWVWTLELDHKRDRRWHVLRFRWQGRHKP
jgi:hypothetical protein